MNRRLAFCVLTLATLSASSIAWAADTYYKWVDQNGVTNYSAYKPHGQDAQAVSIKTGQAEPAPSDAAQSTSNSPGNAQSSGTTTVADSGQRVPDPERCNAARENLKILQENARVRVRESDGTFRFLNEAEKAAKIQESQQAVQESC